jgi:hypothetical protein
MHSETDVGDGFIAGGIDKFSARVISDMEEDARVLEGECGLSRQRLRT